MTVDQTDTAERTHDDGLGWVGSKVDVAGAAFNTGRTRTIPWRRTQLNALQAMLEECAPAIREALWSDPRKNEIESQMTEIVSVINEVQFALKNLDAWTADRKVKAPALVGRTRAMIHREPLGTVLVIGPWNYPINLILTPLVAALAAGNAVVLKPSEMSPASSALLADLVPQYLDAEAVQVSEGAVDETTRLLECNFDHIFYTGNGVVGSIVMTASAKTLTPVTLELG
ncbi:MAG: aldehyde dehydrogenase family protein, partial [Ornithinimicrobium sp.]